ncbi:MAG: hypothetical protein ACJ8R9_17885 [Steroidobacteraceae bacterium]
MRPGVPHTPFRMNMDRRDFALAALSGAKRGSFSPVQLQKLLFLLDRNIAVRVGSSGFDFQPYHYGPFDQRVYVTLEELKREGLAEISDEAGSHRTYRLTAAGQASGERLSAAFGQDGIKYIEEVCDFVRAQSFASLVSSIYRAYPEMKVNSVFQQ